MASGVEHDGLGPFQYVWRAPVAMADRLPDGSFSDAVRRFIGERFVPEQERACRTLLAIGQEAVVLYEQKTDTVKKFLPTGQAAIDVRREFIQHTTAEAQRALGSLVVASRVDVEENPYLWSPAEDILTITQPYVSNVLDNATHVLRPRERIFDAASNTRLRGDVEKILGLLSDCLDRRHSFVPDIQGRGANLLLVTDNSAASKDQRHRLVLVDTSFFSLDGPLHPVGSSGIERTRRIFSQFKAWLDESA